MIAGVSTSVLAHGALLVIATLLSTSKVCVCVCACMLCMDVKLLVHGLVAVTARVCFLWPVHTCVCLFILVT